MVVSVVFDHQRPGCRPCGCEGCALQAPDDRMEQPPSDLAMAILRFGHRRNWNPRNCLDPRIDAVLRADLFPLDDRILLFDADYQKDW